ncbi:DUF1289 domain-containing protein [Shewanella litorisediminis]|uniref:DUF1289 domain-containing protein n=1 Tax=Shewanella litorisediminis TaxID=1173586 RepID=A0ABX7FZB9_9GAMM|nr:DUF1289 domain-containing protein [Shewanella litorisediminis]MCL2919582.1 DUF1289 domain-containing protein [Shewanella litorisediminis]QRH00382.1 DUF1289 domain-containing protein [Shewanella litorisediminis]
MDKLPSPCVRNCCLTEEDICMGCGRSYQEILDWHQANAQRQQMILDKARERLDTLAKARGNPIR